MNKTKLFKKAVAFEDLYKRLSDGDRAEVDAIAKNLQLSKKIGALRRAKEISQYQLAKTAGVSRSYLRSIEKGEKVNVGLVTLYKIANAVGGELTFEIE